MNNTRKQTFVSYTLRLTKTYLITSVLLGALGCGKSATQEQDAKLKATKEHTEIELKLTEKSELLQKAIQAKESVEEKLAQAEQALADLRAETSNTNGLNDEQKEQQAAEIEHLKELLQQLKNEKEGVLMQLQKVEEQLDQQLGELKKLQMQVPFSPGVQGEPDVAQNNATIEQLKKDYEQKIDTLRTQIQTLQSEKQARQRAQTDPQPPTGKEQKNTPTDKSRAGDKEKEKSIDLQKLENYVDEARKQHEEAVTKKNNLEKALEALKKLQAIEIQKRDTQAASCKTYENAIQKVAEQLLQQTDKGKLAKLEKIKQETQKTLTASQLEYEKLAARVKKITETTNTEATKVTEATNNEQTMLQAWKKAQDVLKQAQGIQPQRIVE